MEGFGRFEYRNGLVYEGQWKLFNGAKMKHGEGVLIFQGISLLIIIKRSMNENIVVLVICQVFISFIYI